MWKAGSIRNRDISDILTASIATTLQAYAIPEKRKGWFLWNEKRMKNNKNDKKVKNKEIKIYTDLKKMKKYIVLEKRKKAWQYFLSLRK